MFPFPDDVVYCEPAFYRDPDRKKMQLIDVRLLLCELLRRLIK